MSMRTKILFPTVLIAIVAAAATLVFNITLFSEYVDETMRDRIEAASLVAENELDGYKTVSKLAARYIAGDTDIIKAISASDMNALSTRAETLISESGIEFCTFLDSDGAVIARVREPDASALSSSAQTGVSAAISGNTLAVLEKGSAARLSVRAYTPVYGDDGTLLGVVSVGKRLDTNEFVDGIKSLLGCEVTVFLGDERIATTVEKDDGTRAVGTKAAENVSQTVLAGNTYTGTAKILSRNALTSYKPIFGGDGKVVGMLFIGRFLDEKTETVDVFIRSGVITVVILLAVFIPVILIIIDRIVTPIRVMVKVARDLAAGNIEAGITVSTKDETSELAKAFNSMIENVQRQVGTIESIAGGDMTVSIEPRSDNDAMNNALVTMLELNNRVFKQIVDSAYQVASGARQITESSNVLAVGATEQAASLEELLGIVGEVDVNARENAAIVKKAAELAETIKNDAEQGAEHMRHMVQAVTDINESNKSVGKIIKMIDDIAFQTSILSLNAAVEAVRAGQYGKGFSAVAEEVRSLAQKSARAAKDTGIILESSITKAELGVVMAGETSLSLDKIVVGITESSRLLSSIADSSERQSTAIENVNEGIGQVSQIVQQNSAIAEENAAASERLNGEFVALTELVSRFKLKNGG